MPLLRNLLCVVTLAVPVAATAQIEVSFRDGAPKDSFVVTNTAGCATAPMTLAIDMSQSTGKLIFDVTGAGAGVEVFQPLEFTGGAEFLAVVPDVSDGQTSLVLDLASLPPGGRVSFTIDVDDTIGQREITVSGSEMQGSQLRVLSGFETEPGTFDDTATARVPTPDCMS
ncbi:MAG: hypothetical protein AAGF50_03135 [Pseudomonadota bacterium]